MGFDAAIEKFPVRIRRTERSALIIPGKAVDSCNGFDGKVMNGLLRRIAGIVRNAPKTIRETAVRFLQEASEHFEVDRLSGA